MEELSALAILPHIRIQNANIISSPLTWGFPAITNFLGAVHRIFRENEFSLKAASVGIICHSFKPVTSRGSGTFTQHLHLAKLPAGKDGNAASRIDEGRGHLEISLVLGMAGELEDEKEGPKLANKINEYMQSMRIAGGSILPSFGPHKPSWHILPDNLAEQSEFFRKFRYSLLPGFALLERRDKLLEHLEGMRKYRPEARSLDALLDICRINWEVMPDPENREKGIWTMREREGWLVPIPAGFRAISPLYEAGRVRNTRDYTTPFRFVESIYTLGEWKSPHRLKSIRELMWQYEFDKDKGLYICTQK